MTLFNASAAFEHFKREIVRHGYRIRNVTTRNHDRHLLIQAELMVPDGDKLQPSGKYEFFYCLYKKDFIHSFNELFTDYVKKYPSYMGYGESINTDCLEFAKNRDATLLFTYPDLKIYQIDSNFLYNYVIKNKLKRVQDKDNEYKIVYGQGETERKNEEEYCFPIRLAQFMRYN